VLKFGAGSLLLFAFLLNWTTAAFSSIVAAPAVQISEIRVDQPGTDTDKYFEMSGATGSSLDTLTYLLIGDGSAGSGVIALIKEDNPPSSTEYHYGQPPPVRKAFQYYLYLMMVRAGKMNRSTPSPAIPRFYIVSKSSTVKRSLSPIQASPRSRKPMSWICYERF
jgi:hypothetical protein